MRPHTRRMLRWGLKLAVSLTAVGLLVYLVGWRDLTAQLAGVRWPWLLCMYGAMLAGQWVTSAQMRFILGGLGPAPSVARVFLASQLSKFYSLVIPGEIASSGAKWANLAAATGSHSAVLNAMVYSRLVQTIVPLTVGTVAMCFHSPLSGTWLVVLPAVFLAGLVASMLLMYRSSVARRLRRWLRRGPAPVPRLVRDRVEKLLSSVAAVRRWPWQRHVVVVGLSSVTTLLAMLGLGFAMRSVGIGVGLVTVLWVFAFLVITRALPLTIGNLGVREGVLVLALAPLGVAENQATAAGLMVFTNFLLMACVGLGYQLALLAGWARWRVTPGTRGGRFNERRQTAGGVEPAAASVSQAS